MKHFETSLFFGSMSEGKNLMRGWMLPGTLSRKQIYKIRLTLLQESFEKYWYSNYKRIDDVEQGLDNQQDEIIYKMTRGYF